MSFTNLKNLRGNPNRIFDFGERAIRYSVRRDKLRIVRDIEITFPNSICAEMGINTEAKVYLVIEVDFEARLVRLQQAKHSSATLGYRLRFAHSENASLKFPNYPEFKMPEPENPVFIKDLEISAGALVFKLPTP